VTLAIYSVSGRRVRALVDGSRAPGEYRTTWDGCDDQDHPMAAGVYYARLETVDRRLTRAITLLR
jgi:flagellar hook assembly protein FlgD